MYVFLIIRNCLELSEQQQGLKLGSVAVAIAYLSETLSVPLCLTLRDSVDVAASSTFYWPDCCCCSLPLSLSHSLSLLISSYFQCLVFISFNFVSFMCHLLAYLRHAVSVCRLRCSLPAINRLLL